MERERVEIIPCISLDSDGETKQATLVATSEAAEEAEHDLKSEVLDAVRNAPTQARAELRQWLERWGYDGAGSCVERWYIAATAHHVATNDFLGVLARLGREQHGG